MPISVREADGDFTPIGTGFLVSHNGANCLVSAKHVIFNTNGQRRNGLFVLVNRREGGADAIALDGLGSDLGNEWKMHGQRDVAASLIPVSPTADLAGFTLPLFEDFQNIKAGDDVFFLGFPLYFGVNTRGRITPLVRTGTVALKNEDSTFLIDGNAFPGSSGSPVFFKPCPIHFGPRGLEMGNVRPPKLLGVVTQTITYTDRAVSVQTGKERVAFEENAALGSVLSASFINELLVSADFERMITTVLERARERTTRSGQTSS